MINLRNVASIAFLALGVASQASIIGVSGSGDVLATGPSVGYTADFFDDFTGIIHGWDEVQNSVLVTNVNVDITGPGFYSTVGSLTPGTILSGTVVSSHTLSFDPLQNLFASATFTFDGTVVGVIVDSESTTDKFVGSDFLIPGSVPLANIPSGHYGNRGLEIASGSDVVSVGVNTVGVSLHAGSPGDHIRVLTVVPEPTSLIALTLGLVTAVRSRRPRVTR